MAALTRLLRAQGIDENIEAANIKINKPQLCEDDTSGALNSDSAAIKKRKLAQNAASGRDPFDSSPGPVVNIDDTFHRFDYIVSPESQERCLNMYIHQWMPLFPMVTLTGDCSFEALRKERPILFIAVVYATSTGILTEDMQYEICKLLLQQISQRAIVEGEKSFQLVQALQITSLWFRNPRHHRHMAIYQLIHLADGIIFDLGISDPSRPRFSFYGETISESIDKISAARACLASYVLSSTGSSLMRRPVVDSWTSHNEECLRSLASSGSTSSGDRWLAQYFRAERICEEITSKLKLCNADLIQDVSDPSYQSQLQIIRNMILDWKVLNPPLFEAPELLMWEHVATALMHESILHTPTNKQSFAAPYIAEHLSATDIARPFVTDAHVNSLKELRAAVQTVINIYTSMDTQLIMALSALLYTSRAVYAMFVLVSIHVALTAPGNTLGAVMDPSSLEVDVYLTKGVALYNRLAEIDARSGPARVTSSALVLRGWFHNYISTTAPAGLASVDVQNLLGAGNLGQTDGDLPLDFSDQISIDWELYFPSSDDATTFDFGSIIAHSAQADLIPDHANSSFVGPLPV